MSADVILSSFHLSSFALNVRLFVASAAWFGSVHAYSALYIVASSCSCIAMAVVEAEMPQHMCKCCGYGYQLSAGRIHGKHFMCQGCHNIQNSIRRNLGDSAEMTSWSAEESLAFFKRLTDEKRAAGDGTLSWKTVRAAMVTTLTEQKVSSFSTNVDAEELPLTVYQARGWSDEIIKRFPSFHSNEYGCEVYRVPVRRLNWKEEFANIENRILQKEQDFAQKKGKGAGKLDVPQEKESPAEAGEKGAARKAAAAQKKLAGQNERVANLAARAMGLLSGAESALTKLLAKAAKAESHDPAALQLCEEQLKVGQEWSKAARVAVNQQQENKAHESQSGTEVCEISPLPFTAEDLKIHLKTTGEAQRSLRNSLPPPKAKAKAGAAPSAAEGTEEPKPKRRRAKSAA